MQTFPFRVYSSHADPRRPNYYRAKVVNVVDGDTMDADVSLAFHLTLRIRIRVLGINAPEIHGEDKPAGLEAKEYAKSLIGEGDVILKTGEATDHFGRWLAEIILPDDRSFADVMIESGHAAIFRPTMGAADPGW